MILVVEFVLDSATGALVEDCIRGILDRYFAGVELTIEPRHTVFIDEQGKFTTVAGTSF